MCQRSLNSKRRKILHLSIQAQAGQDRDFSIIHPYPYMLDASPSSKPAFERTQGIRQLSGGMLMRQRTPKYASLYASESILQPPISDPRGHSMRMP